MAQVIEINRLAREIARERVQVRREPVVLELRAQPRHHLAKAIRSVVRGIADLLTTSARQAHTYSTKRRAIA